MKLIATIAALSAVSNALNLEAKAETEAQAEVAVEATTEVQAEAEQSAPSQGWSGPIVPEVYSAAVKDFDLSTPFTSQEEYKKQLDIYSDQIIAIEALRMEIIKLDYSITKSEEDYTTNARRILANADKIMENHQNALNNKANIEKLQMDVDDVGTCLNRQFDE
mmetsp:Transcript_27662/g.34353  ORF Transcript_27662/g.34353 Transcript_27662/m.34353 type:complete len:164 (+) Transcript_27662:36-527(+)|eukprot:CAMPEP_0170464878 /NCGR_PEP_ID=MMETSP0123-20130129/9425_1 /TAXON_ID=182087 /ORGANISM="Favella ehrenbergii, Strain Fehren 1" /LENGTH=163 /DNA_ID=CAMNT_0010730621 /DNA_START=35 /DNA_END=526 /DNA_ORIENTATION=+